MIDADIIQPRPGGDPSKDRRRVNSRPTMAQDDARMKKKRKKNSDRVSGILLVPFAR
jgi:hypothetical protein